MPKELYFEYSDKLVKNLPYLFISGGFWFVSMEIVDTLRQFNMGEGAFYPVKVFQHDQKTPVEGTYFCWNFGNTKEAVLLEKTIGACKSPYPDGDQRRSFTGILNDNDIAIRATAVDGPDIWLDPQFRQVFFFSDQLVQALKEMKIASIFRFKKCRIVHDN